ncbi:MAG: hypothetical protein IIA14_00140 [SAR324 cluster bacterium]|nr:hypothetical protein [SAR324 cluster bacterium]
MKIEHAVETLWSATRAGEPHPESLRGALTMEEAYRVQRGILAKWNAAGEKQGGWKIALTAEKTRRMIGSETPLCGFLLAGRALSSGQAVPCAGMRAPAVEAELCVTLDRDLAGPGVTREQVLAAGGTVMPALEVVEERGKPAADLPLAVADNILQWGYVLGEPATPFSAQMDFAAVTVEIVRNGEQIARLLAAEVIDDQLSSVAWLANKLSEFGEPLRAGQRILTGSFMAHHPVVPGETWEATFSPFGKVAVRFE